MRIHGELLIPLALALALALASPDETAAAEVRERDACADLRPPALVTLETAPAWVDAPGLPKYCRVRGRYAERVRFEMRLPATWNGRFLMAGCGGFCGELLPDKSGHSNSINEPLKRGYAGISHDAGHQAPSWEASWARDPEALEIWAHKILPMMTELGTQLIEQLYGRPPRYRYFAGCSNGGRLGLMAAQRYPQLFDGIAAGAGIFDLSGNAGLWGNWLITSIERDGVSIVPPRKARFLEKFVVEQCDARDGLADQTIDDPTRCSVDFRAARCAPGAAPADDCLTAAEADALNRLYGGVRNAANERIYPALQPGSERYSDIWLYGAADRPAWGILASAGYRQLLAASLAVPDVPAGLPTERMLDWIRRSPVPALTDATNPDLTALRRRGGKLLIYQGLADPLIIPEPIMDYYRRAAVHAGGMRRLQKNVRLFMVPGWGHCWERPSAAPDDFDPLAALENWVERGRTPRSIDASQRGKDGTIVRARPICSYPASARHIAGKDPARLDAYRCVAE